MNQTIWLAFCSGFILQLGMIMSLGLQNLYIIKKGIRKEHPFWVALTCCICEALLLIIGAYGASWILNALPELRPLIVPISAAFLGLYGLISVGKAVLTRQAKQDSTIQATASLSGSVMVAAGFSLLNPQAVVESILLFGSLSQEKGDLGSYFLVGAFLASIVWLMSLATISNYSKITPSAKSMRLLEVASGGTLMVMGALLVL